VLVVPTIVDVLKVVFVEVALRELVEVAAVLELVQVYSPEPFSQGGRHWEKYILYLLQTCGEGHSVGPIKAVTQRYNH
jgi:hypothetical protein